MRALALLFFLAGCGAVEGMSTGDESSIQGGHSDSDDPAVGMLWLEGGGFCSGVLIAPSVVLTAGHCVAHPVEGFYTGAGKRTAPVGSEPADSLVRHAVADQAAHPSYSPWGGCPNQTFDVGVVRLAHPIPKVHPAARAVSPPNIGRSCRIVGYGMHNGGAEHITFEQKRDANVRVLASGTTWLSVQWKNGISDHGDSGGPLLCGDKIAGVTSCGTDGSYPDHRSSYYARVDNIDDWLDRVIQAWK
jgi:secreted trypsin-like serine protease